MSVVIYLSNQQVQVIEGAGNGKSISVKKYYSLEAPENSIVNGIVMDAESFVDFLKNTWKEYKLATKDVILVISSTKFVGRKLDLPKLNDKKTFEFIAREYADMGREANQIYSYIPIAHKENKVTQAYVEGIEPDFIKDYISIFEEANIKLSKVYSNESSLITFCANTAAKNHKTFVLLIADEMTLTRILWVDGSFYYFSASRCFHEPGTEEYAEDIAHSLSQLSQFMKANQIEATLEVIELAGVNPDDKAMYSQAISSLNISTPVNIFNFTTGNGSVVDPNMQSYLHVVSGLYSNGNNQNFLPRATVKQQDAAEQENKREILSIAMPSLIALGVAVIVVVVLFIMKAGKVKELNVLDGYNKDMDVMMEVARFDALASRNAYLAAQYDAIDDISKNLDTYPCGNSTVLNVFEECAQDLAHVDYDSFDAEAGIVQISAWSENVEDINKFIRKLMDRSEFKFVDYTGYSFNEEDDKWNINVSCTLAEAAGR